MRDLYNRKEKLAYWILKAKTELEEPDRKHVLEFIEYMQEKDKSILWIIRCITALVYIRRQLDKSFVDCKKEYIKSLFAWMDTKNYKASTHEKLRKILKIFYKVVFGKNEFHLEQVNWFSTQVGKEKRSQERDLDIAKISFIQMGCTFLRSLCLPNYGFIVSKVLYLYVENGCYINILKIIALSIG